SCGMKLGVPEIAPGQLIQCASCGTVFCPQPLKAEADAGARGRHPAAINERHAAPDEDVHRTDGSGVLVWTLVVIVALLLLGGGGGRGYLCVGTSREMQLAVEDRAMLVEAEVREDLKAAEAASQRAEENALLPDKQVPANPGPLPSVPADGPIASPV